MQTLNADQIVALVKSTPEKAVFDWKTDFILPQDNDKQGEFLKDLAAIANTCVASYGFIIYGVDPRRPDPICGITVHYDDANLQQLTKGKIEPLPDFLYYEVSVQAKAIGVLQVSPTRHRPHIISVDLGKIRRGQIVIRRGSSTDGVTINDLLDFFLARTAPTFHQSSKGSRHRHSSNWQALSTCANCERKKIQIYKTWRLFRDYRRDRLELFGNVLILPTRDKR